MDQEKNNLGQTFDGASEDVAHGKNKSIWCVNLSNESPSENSLLFPPGFKHPQIENCGPYSLNIEVVPKNQSGNVGYVVGENVIDDDRRDFLLKEDHLVAALVAKCNAKRIKKGVKKRNKDKSAFKRRATKIKPKNGDSGTLMVELNDVEEVRITRDIGKQLGLYVEKDKVLTALVKGRESMRDELKENKRKRNKGEKK